MKFRILLALGAILLLIGRQSGFGQTISSNYPEFGSPGDPVTIYGSGFAPGGSPPASLVVKFNNTTDPTAGVVADNVIQAVVPSGATTGRIKVQINGGPLVQSPQNFTVVGAGPYVTDFSPDIGSAGATITLDGGHFDNATGVNFNGVPGTNFNPAQNQIQVMVPVGATTGPLTVLSSLGTSFNFTTTSNFFITPTIISISPAAAPVGTNITIIGTSFLGATNVQFNGVDAVSFVVLNNTNISVVVPTNATTGPISVTAPAASVVTTSNFIVQPRITGFTPNAGNTGTNITITGLNLFGVTSVLIGGASATFSNVQYASVGAKVPAGATNGPITIVTTNGTATSGTNLFYVPPVINSFTPTNGVPGTIVTIFGLDFLGATNVSFNGASASFSVSNNNKIVATVPNGATTGPISVAGPAGTNTSGLLFYLPPVITSFIPTHGLPGTNVTIFGTNFLGASAVKFNGTSASVFTVINNGQINTVVPSGATTGPISVVAPAGTAVSSSDFTIDAFADLSIGITDVPDPVFVTSNLTYTITVANAGPISALNVVVTNSLPVSVSLKSATASQGGVTANGNIVVANLGTLNPNASATVTLVVTPQTPGTIQDIATVSSTITDFVTGNNSQLVNTTVLPLSALSISLGNNGLILLSWPSSLTLFSLQSELSLTPPSTWSNVTIPVQTVGDQNTVTDTNLGVMKFYRLIQTP